MLQKKGAQCKYNKALFVCAADLSGMCAGERDGTEYTKEPC